MKGTQFSQYGMSDIFDNIFKGFEILLPQNVDLYPTMFPPADVIINDQTKDVVFKFAVAGYKQDAVDLSFVDDKLVLSLKGGEGVKEGYTFLKNRIKSSDCEVSYYIPFEKYDVDNAEATLEDGILTVKIAAKEEIKPKKITINKN